MLTEAPPTQTTAHEDPAEGVNVAIPPPDGVNELNVPAPTPPRAASPPAAAGEPNVSSAGQPGPSGQPELAGQSGSSKQPRASASASASGSGVTREAPSMGSTEVGEGSVSLSDFSAAEIYSHLINHDIYIGEGWEHVKGKPCNRKMEFFFNCHSLVGLLP